MWKKLVVIALGIVFMEILLTIATKAPNLTTFEILVFRIILSVIAGAIGAITLGLVGMNLDNLIQIGGGLILFVIVYEINLPQLVNQKKSNKKNKKK